MDVGELYKRLSYGELGNLKIGSNGDGTIASGSESKILHHTNTALTLLYSRFSIRRAYVTLRYTAAREKYEIRAIHNESDETPENTAPRYIVDTVEEPFLGDLIKVIEIKDENGALVTLDDRSAEYTTETLEFDVLNIPPIEMDVAETEKLLKIRYQARHPALALNAVPSTPIDIPPVLEEALLMKVSSRVYANMNGEGNAMKSQMLDAQYDKICQEALLHHLVPESASAPQQKIADRGWL